MPTTSAVTEGATDQNLPPQVSEGDAGEAAKATEPIDWRKVLDGVPPAELLKDNRIAGIVGAKGQEIGRRIAAEDRAAEKAAAEARRIRELEDYDPAAAIAEKRAAEARAEDATRAYSDIDTTLNGMFFQLSRESQNRLSNKQYFGSPSEARQAYLADLTNAMALDRLQEELPKQAQKSIDEARAKWEKDELPALRKQALRGSVASEPSPDRGGGGAPASSGPMTQEEFDQIRGDRAKVSAAKERINAGLAQRLITR